MTTAAYFASLAAQVENTNDCAELQALIDRIMPSLSAESAGITSQLSAIGPILALLTPPSDPAGAVIWVTDFITHVLTPQYAPYAIYTTQLADLISAVATLTTAVNDAASRIGNCSITIPPL